KAVDQFEKAIALQTVAFGASDPFTLKTRSSLGLALFRSDQSAQAKQVLQGTLADQTRVLGAGHRDTLQTAVILGLVLKEMYDDQDVSFNEKTYQQALQSLGPRNQLTLEAESNYAWALRWRGQPQKALELAELAARGLQDLMGEENSHTMFAAYNRACCLDAVGRRDEAAVAFRQLLATRNRVLGPTHVDSLFTAWHLADNRRVAGDPSAALAVLDSVMSSLKSSASNPSVRRSEPM